MVRQENEAAEMRIGIRKQINWSRIRLNLILVFRKGELGRLGPSQKLNREGKRLRPKSYPAKSFGQNIHMNEYMNIFRMQ